MTAPLEVFGIGHLMPESASTRESSRAREMDQVDAA